jgi:phospholipid/cholesterol/gamma-HCH transport system substrate-binding protein
MPKKDSLKNFLAGIFFVLGVTLIFIFIFTIGKERGFAQPKFQVQILYQEVEGLAEGAPVRLAGVNIGIVSSIDFLKVPVEGRQVVVTLNIFKRYKSQLVKKAKYAIQTEGILGEKLIEIDIINDQETVDLTKPLLGEDPLNVETLVQAFADAAESFTKTANELQQIDMVEMADLMIATSKAMLETSNGINSIMDELQEVTRRSRRLIDRVEQKLIEGTLFKIF